MTISAWDSIIERALAQVFDHALVFHGFADFTRDYDIYVDCPANPKSGIGPETLRVRFKHCVRAETTSMLSAAIWSDSLDDRLINYEQGVQLDGYGWGVKWQCLYPGGRLLTESAEAAAWTAAVGIEFHEVLIETNVQMIRLVFSGLEVAKVEPGETPFTVADDGPDSATPETSQPDAFGSWFRKTCR
jgi:hypothetical protein